MLVGKILRKNASATAALDSLTEIKITFNFLFTHRELFHDCWFNFSTKSNEPFPASTDPVQCLIMGANIERLVDCRMNEKERDECLAGRYVVC